MNNKKLIYTFFTVLLFTALLMAGCSSSETSDVNEDLNRTQEVQENSNPQEETDMSNSDDRTSEDNSENDATQDSIIKIDADDYIRSDDRGGVIVDAVWSTYDLYAATDKKELIKEYEIDKYHVFDLMLTTHSGDLRSYSYMDNASLTIDGLKIQPVNADVISSDSHHPRVLLKFPLLNNEGKEYIIKDSTLELLLKDLRGIPERRFIWDLPFE